MTPRPQPDSLIPVLLYHSVSSDPLPGHEEFTVTPESFARHVEVMAGAGRVPVSIEHLAASLRGERALPERPIAVTFDDGFADVHPAVESLLAAGLEATVFVTSGYLDGERMLSSAGLRELAALGPGVEIGAHSVSHPHLDEIPLARVVSEVAESKETIESVLGAPVHTFAYPHGSYDAAVRRVVVESGFAAAAAVKNAFSHHRDDPYAVARLTVTAATDTAELRRYLDESGAPRAWRRERLRTRAYRSWRRHVRR